MSEREILILRDRQFEMGQRGAVGRLVPREAIKRAAFKIIFVGRDIPGPAGRRLDGGDLDRHRLRDRARDVALHRENVGELAVDAVGPARKAGAAIDEVGGDAGDVAAPLHRSGQEKADAEAGGDRLRRRLAALAFSEEVPARTWSAGMRVKAPRTSSVSPSAK